MDSYLNSTENLDFIVLENVNQSQSSTRESSTNKSHNFDSSNIFSATDLSEFSMQSKSNDLEDILDLDEFPFITLPPSSIDGVYRYLKEAVEVVHRIEPNNIASQPRNDNDDEEHLAMTRVNNESLPVIRSFLDKSTNGSIPLSESVAIPVSKPRKLQLVYPIEDTYRPRYKSDYFPQSGSVRHPRYIADNQNNHFITLELLNEYEYELHNKYIRVALITTHIEGHGYYYSPYKFQRDHNDSKAPDKNPIYVKVETNRDNAFVMRLQLVLIKSKLDQLNYVQPLKLFSDRTTEIQNIIHEEILTPKELIARYQLEKSHLAFTLCTQLPNGSYELYPDTTIISSVISEVSTPRKKNETSSSTAAPSVNSNQHLCCPHCAHQFESDITTESNRKNKRTSDHETSSSCSEMAKKTSTTRRKKNK